MEIGHLINKFKRGSTPATDKFLAIQIDSEFVKTAVWTITDHKTNILAFGDTAEWDGASTEILLEAIDNSLSQSLEKATPETAQPDQVIFGLPEAWVTKDGITQSRMADLRIICDKLSLKPLGFVVTTEAITHYLKSKEGTPLTAILLRVSLSEVAVSIVNLGQIEATHVAGRSGDIAADTLEGIARFGQQESLPSRMILYNGGGDLQDLSQELLAFDWLPALPFVHLPKIEATNETFSITAIAVAGGTEVAKSLGFAMIELPSDETPKTADSSKTDTSITTAAIDATNDLSDAFIPDTPSSGEETSTETIQANVPQFPVLKPRLNLPLTKIFSVGHIFLGVFSKLRKFKPRSPLPATGFVSTGIIVILLLISILVLVVQAAKRLPKARVQLTFSAGSINQRLPIIVDATAKSIDAQKRILPAEKITVTKTGESTAEATGTKTTGDKAKGEVTIYNKTNATKKFTAGTFLAGPGNKQFLLDQDTLVASQSAQEAGVTYGSANAAVTAGDFGPEYNFESGTELVVSNLSPSAFNAINKSAFSGGTKKDTKAVSKKDQAQLAASLLAKLKEGAAEEIVSRGQGKQIFIDTTEVNNVEEKFNSLVGDEADSLSLTLTASFTTLAVSDQDYYQLIALALQGQIPPEYTLVTDKIKTSIENTTPQGSAVAFDVVISAPLAPRLNQNDLLAAISGKRPAEAAQAVKSLPRFKSLDISLQPALPAILQWVPVNKNNIVIDINLEE